MAKTRWVCVFCKRIMRSISGGLEELKSNKLFYVLFEKNGESNILFFWKCEGLHQKFISKVLEILVNTHLEDLPIVNVHWMFLLWICNENLTIYLILLIYNSQLCDEWKIFKMGKKKFSWACYRVERIPGSFEILFYHKVLFKLRCPYCEYLQ